jgi:crotonobetainyl-CoA:carnitine CoA-transferase CaiB-like acyl-CoA transferase/putative sterol carrier protein
MDITASRILESAPMRFRPEKASTVTSTFHFIISGDENFGYTITIVDSKCTLTKELTGTPTCTIKTTARTYIELETGKANPQMALMTGKIKVSNIGEMMQFAKCFRRFEEKYLRTTDDGQQTTNNALTVDRRLSTVRSSRTGPLEGVKVIDFTRLLPGPLATMMLADMGADVIKVEDPDSPDYIRSFEPMIDGTSAFYYALNRNKRSLAINFLSAEGKQVILDLVKSADVFIEQYRPGVMKNFGLDYDALRAVNPRLIYVSITGYGQESSMSQAAGHDLNYISIAGMLSVTGDETGKPVIPGFQLADIAGGSYMAVNAVTAALFKRERTKTGEWLDVAMTDSVLPFMALPFAEYQATGNKHARGKFQLAGGQANYNIYQCSDGKYLALGSLEPKFWNKVCERLDKPDWREKVIGGNDVQMAIKKQLQEIFITKPRSEWIAFFAKDDICLTPVNDLDELASDVYLNERKLFIDFDVNGKTFKTIASPVRFESTGASNNWIAPRLGEDTYNILIESGMDESQIKNLIKKNIIKV